MERVQKPDYSLDVSYKRYVQIAIFDLKTNKVLRMVWFIPINNSYLKGYVI